MTSRRFSIPIGHLCRVGALVAIVLLIHFKHQQRSRGGVTAAVPELRQVQPFLPDASRITADSPGTGWMVQDGAGEPVGSVWQTSPESDGIIGFSGPTNTLVIFDTSDRIVGLTIASSGDTREHVREVREDPQFLKSFNGLTREEAGARTDVDAVSGATLTSLAIVEGVVRRLGGAAAPRRFPEPVSMDDVREMFPTAATLEPLRDSVWEVRSEQTEVLGTVVRISPAADQLVGYQGPTDALFAIVDGRVQGFRVLESYDNDRYVGWVREEYGFLALFDGLTVRELAELDLEAAGIEGVSGATMTSMAVAQGLIAAADRYLHPPEPPPPPADGLQFSVRDIGTAVVVGVGLLVGLTRLRGRRRFRLMFQLVLIGYLGLVNGDMVSQALLTGWARNGVPWRSCGGLVLLTAAALLIPIAARRNTYCSHLCPHGAVQQLVRNRLPWRLRIRGRWRWLAAVPWLLLMWVVFVAITDAPYSLVDIEPFDAWVIRVAGVASLAIAVVGLVASLFIPMAYCRYGCPTGALLEYVRRRGRGNRPGRRDLAAAICLVLAVILYVV